MSIKNESEPFYSYNINQTEVSIVNGTLRAALNLTNSSLFIAEKLTIELTLYQNGILRVLIDEIKSTRFRISEHASIEEGNLNVQRDAFKVEGNKITARALYDGSEISYEIGLAPFRIRQFVNG